MELKDLVTSILKTKEDLTTHLEGARELTDAPAMWVTNRMISLFPDCVLDCNEINIVPGIDDTMQYDFLRLRLPKRTKTFTPWLKPEKSGEDVEVVQKYYQYSEMKAKEALDILSPEQLQTIRDSFLEGGIMRAKGNKK